MAKTGCRCGVGIWNGYVPGGVNWDIFPMHEFREVAFSNPNASLLEVRDLVSEKYYDYGFHELWLCRRCRRIQIWKMDGLYVSYDPVDFDNSISIEEIKNMGEWIAINDWDYEAEYTGVYVLEHFPFRPLQYFVSSDKSKIYVYNRETNSIEYVYKEYVREIEPGRYRTVKGVYRNEYKGRDGMFIGSFFDNGERYEFEEKNGDLSDAVYGFVLGDALGVPFEFKDRGTFKCEGMVGYGTHNQPEGTWSDDTSLMLATCKSLKDNNLKINISDMKEKYLRWLDKAEFTANGEVFDVGGTTYKALRTGCPQKDEKSNGNGSLMRILPLAFIDCTDDEIRAVSEITHGHWIAKEACVIFVNTIKRYLSQDLTAANWQKLEDIIKSIPEYPAPFDRLSHLDTLKESEIRSTGYVIDTLEAAFWCILQEFKTDNWSNSYSRTLKRAVNLGGDTDTIAAITGALAGLAFSFDEIQDDWVYKIKNNKLIQDCLF